MMAGLVLVFWLAMGGDVHGYFVRQRAAGQQGAQGLTLTVGHGQDQVAAGKLFMS
jgi:hypothetical protein